MSEEKSLLKITALLQDWNSGKEEAKEHLIPFVYEELKRQARILMSKERLNHTLQATALVHEAFLKLSAQTGIDWQNRSHFYGVASRLMRQILIDHARLHLTEKRGNRPVYFSLDDAMLNFDAIISVKDMTGREIFRKEERLINGVLLTELEPWNNAANGMYLVTVSIQDNAFNGKSREWMKPVVYQH